MPVKPERKRKGNAAFRTFCAAPDACPAGRCRGDSIHFRLDVTRFFFGQPAVPSAAFQKAPPSARPSTGKEAADCCLSNEAQNHSRSDLSSLLSAEAFPKAANASINDRAASYHLSVQKSITAPSAAVIFIKDYCASLSGKQGPGRRTLSRITPPCEKMFRHFGNPTFTYARKKRCIRVQTVYFPLRYFTVFLCASVKTAF